MTLSSAERLQDLPPRAAPRPVTDLTTPAATGSLRQLQITQLAIAEAVAALCDRHSISYVLLGGSALGARRHGGFIPWDDDMDLGMLREDFDRFVALARKHLPSDLYLQYWLDDPHMGVPFAKIRMNGTRLVEYGSRDTGGHKGIAIDIFPFDAAPRGRAGRVWKFQLMFLKRLLRHQTGYTVRDLSRLKLAADLQIRMLARRVSMERTRRALHRTMTRFASRECDRALAVGGAYDFRKDMLEKRWLTERRQMMFEGRKFYCPEDIDGYLTHMYGDFLALPPFAQRTSRHGILELNFGERDSADRGRALG